jgi:hypothetical protein
MRTLTLTLAAAAILGAGVAPSATAADAKVSGKAEAHAQVSVQKSIDKTEHKLVKVLKSDATARLEAEARAEVRANIKADIEALADLSADLEGAAKAEVRDIRDEVKDFRAQVYKQVVVMVNKAEETQNDVEKSQASASVGVDLQFLLDGLGLEIGTNIDAALELDALSTKAEVREAKADIEASQKTFVRATR